MWCELARLGLGGEASRARLTCPPGMTWAQFVAVTPHCHLQLGEAGDLAWLLNRPSWLLDGRDTVCWLLRALYSDVAWLPHVEHVLRGGSPPMFAAVLPAPA